MHVSDYLQEFLSVPDQLKLIEFDNQKMLLDHNSTQINTGQNQVPSVSE